MEALNYSMIIISGCNLEKERINACLDLSN
jgi:hypothetical protein